MARVTWLQQGEAQGVGEKIEAALRAQLQGKGLELDFPEAMESGEGERLSAREIRRIGFDNQSDAVVIGRGEGRGESDRIEYSLAVYSAQSGVRLGNRSGSISALDFDSAEARVWAGWVLQTLDLPARDPVEVQVEETVRPASVPPSNQGGLDNLLRFSGPNVFSF